MSIKQIDRLMFAQGDKCFFCKDRLAKADASVEHLIAVTNGGDNNDENCVVCCKSINNLFGRISLKEKLQIILNQNGQFQCPIKNKDNISIDKLSVTKTKTIPEICKNDTDDDKIKVIITNLKKQGNSKPVNKNSLLNMIRNYFKTSNTDINKANIYLQQMIDKAYIIIDNNQIKYFLP